MFTNSVSLYLSSVSTVFEDYQWTLRALFGFALVLLGNYVVLTRAGNQAG
jgi:hypothetical protein